MKYVKQKSNRLLFINIKKVENIKKPKTRLKHKIIF
jgi:hypothetical protein